MKFRSKAVPVQSVGTKYSGKSLVVPNQAMSLQEIIKRFTRNEAVPVGRDAQYFEGDVDLDKIAHADLVDKAEFIEQQKATQKEYSKQEAAKATAERKRLLKEARDKVEAEVRAEGARAPDGGKL